MAAELGQINTNTQVVEASDIGAPNGVAGLDANGKVPVDQLGLRENSVCFGGNNGWAQTNNTAWTNRAAFVFPGTNKVLTPSKINALVWGNAGAGATGADIRIVDVTNSQVIATVLGVGTSPTVITDMGVLSNIPAGEAIFVVQIRRLGPSGQARVSSLTLEY
jgi:hypothetical protein